MYLQPRYRCPPIVAPEVLSIDEKHIVHQMRGIFVDNKTGRLLEMTEDNRRATVIQTIETTRYHGYLRCYKKRHHVSNGLDAIFGASYNKNYWFSNAHEYLMNCCPSSPRDVLCTINGTKVLTGSDEYTYVAAAVKYIEYCASTDIVNPNGGWRDPDAMSSSKGLYQYKFRTSETLAYHEKAPAMNAIGIRGVLEVTVNNNDYVKNNPDVLNKSISELGLQNVKAGETYYVDAEFVVGVNSYGCFTRLAEYMLTNKGPVLWS